MGTKIFGANRGIATSNAIPDNTSVAMDIESTDAKDYITIDTTDGNEIITLGQKTYIYGEGGSAGGSAKDLEDVALYIENGTANSAAACVAEINSTGSNGSQLILSAADAHKGVVKIEGSSSHDMVLGTFSGAGDVKLQAGGVEGLRITESGGAGLVTMTQDAGIGETSPTSHWPMATTLVVKDTSNAGITICSNASNNQGTLVFADGVASDATSSGGMIQYTHTGDYFRFTAKYNGNSPRADDSGEHVMRCNEYGMGKMRYSTAYDSTARDSAISTFRPVYLATTSSTNDTLVLDYEHGSIGEITLTNNITAIKVFNAPRHGSAQTMTVKIKQHSTAVTLSYSSVTIYWSTSVTRAGNLLWSGGATHVLSTGNNEIDIVQFTCLPHGDTNRDIYASVIGQNFS